jgi:hypothetical protein
LKDDNLTARVGEEIAHLVEATATFIEGGGMWNPFKIYGALSGASTISKT